MTTKKNKNNPKKKADKVNEVTQKLNNIVVKQEQEQEKEVKGKHILTTQDVLDALPKDTRVNIRKDGFVKLFEGNVYIRNATYGVQMSENRIGAPGKVILAIKNQAELKTAVAQIKENIANPVSRERGEATEGDEVKIGMQYETREALRKIKKSDESWNALFLRLAEK